MGALRDANPGDVFRDRDGDTWTRTETGARVEFTGQTVSGGDAPKDHDASFLGIMEEAHGPMTPIAPAVAPTCETCRFWRRADGWQGETTDKRRAFGECRKRSPGVLTDGENAGSVAWPQTRDNDFCGEHEATR